MSLQTITLLISFLALAVSIGGFLSSRQATWSFRYYERWFQLARLVLDHPKDLFPLCCSDLEYRKTYGKKAKKDDQPTPQELVFAEMYVDFMMEVHRRGWFFAFLSGRYPGQVPLTNPRTIYLWDKYVRHIYSIKQQARIDRLIPPSLR